MKKTQKQLMMLFACIVILGVAIVILFETNLWASGCLADNAQTEFLLTTLMELMTLGCAFLGLRLFKFKKVKSDLEFELTNVKPGTWRVVAGWIEQTADAYEYSDALRSWSAKEDGQAKAKSLRVSFEPFDQSIGTEELEQTEQ